MKKIVDNVFVRLEMDERKEMQRGLLESQASLLTSLASFEELKELTKEKKLILGKIRGLTKEIKENLKILEENMPRPEELKAKRKKKEGKEEGKKKEKEKVETKKEEKIKEKKEKPLPPKMAEPKLEKKTKKLELRKELEEIRERLKKI